MLSLIALKYSHIHPDSSVHLYIYIYGVASIDRFKGLYYFIYVGKFYAYQVGDQSTIQKMLRFEFCDCLYDGHWRFIWLLSSGPVGLVEVRASWSGHPR
jgi:hypothetical protein